MANIPIINDVTYSQLVSKIGLSELEPGIYYRITDYSTMHYMLNGDDVWVDTNNNNAPFIVTGKTEPLTVLAIDVNKLDYNARSEQYPQDIIHYDWNPDNWTHDIGFSNYDAAVLTGFTGVIYFRHDTYTDVYMGYDFRNAKFRRWNNHPDMDWWPWLTDYQGNNWYSTGVIDVNDFIDVYTFSCPIAEPDPESVYTNEVRSVHIETFRDREDYWALHPTILANNVFYLDQATSYYQIYEVKLDSNSCTNTFNSPIESLITGHEFYSNQIGTDQIYNIFGNYCAENVIGNNIRGNVFGNEFSYNNIKGECTYNTFGNNISYLQILHGYNQYGFNKNYIHDGCGTLVFGSLTTQYVYNMNVNCELIKRLDGTVRLRYIDDNDNVVITYYDAVTTTTTTTEPPTTTTTTII